MTNKKLEVVAEDGRRLLEEDVREERIERLVALGRALSDPIRVRMIGMMAEGRGCCDLSDLGVPVDEGEENIGICVCEFEDYFGIGTTCASSRMLGWCGRRRGGSGAFTPSTEGPSGTCSTRAPNTSVPPQIPPRMFNLPANRRPRDTYKLILMGSWPPDRRKR